MGSNGNNDDSSSSTQVFANAPRGPLGIDPLKFSVALFVLLVLYVFYLLLPRAIRKQYFGAYPKRHAWSARSRRRNFGAVRGHIIRHPLVLWNLGCCPNNPSAHAFAVDLYLLLVWMPSAVVSRFVISWHWNDRYERPNDPHGHRVHARDAQFVGIGRSTFPLPTTTATTNSLLGSRARPTASVRRCVRSPRRHCGLARSTTPSTTAPPTAAAPSFAPHCIATPSLFANSRGGGCGQR